MRWQPPAGRGTARGAPVSPPPHPSHSIIINLTWSHFLTLFGALEESNYTPCNLRYQNLRHVFTFYFDAGFRIRKIFRIQPIFINEKRLKLTYLQIPVHYDFLVQVYCIINFFLIWSGSIKNDTTDPQHCLAVSAAFSKYTEEQTTEATPNQLFTQSRQAELMLQLNRQRKPVTVWQTLSPPDRKHTLLSNVAEPKPNFGVGFTSAPIVFLRSGYC